MSTTASRPPRADSKPALPAFTKRALRMPALRAKVGLSPATIYVRVAAGTFPQPFKLGPGATAWWEHEVDAWLDVCAAESRTGAQA
jgi:prophage regulatory protein